MIQNITYKYRLYPNEEQKVLLAKHFGCVRFLYNRFLDERIIKYKDEKITLNYYNNSNEIPNLKQEFPWLKEVGSQSLQYAARQLQNSYDNFFRNVKQNKPGKKGFPQFKNKHNKQSFRVPQYTNLLDDQLWIPKFKTGIKIVLHRPLEGKICFATISKNRADQYFVSITCEVNVEEKEKLIKVVGLDLNVKYIVASDGQRYENPTFDRQKQRKLAKAISRKEKGSKGREKAKLKLNRFKLKNRNQSEDFQHKVSKKLIDENQVIVLESLDVASMLENINKEKRRKPRWKEKVLHRSLGEARFSAFTQKLIYKAKWCGRSIIRIDKWFPSSQLCSNCGFRFRELGEEKTWKCQNCYTVHDRDENAAKNILAEGLNNNRWNDEDSQMSSYVSQEDFLLALS